MGLLSLLLLPSVSLAVSLRVPLFLSLTFSLVRITFSLSLVFGFSSLFPLSWQPLKPFFLSLSIPLCCLFIFAPFYAFRSLTVPFLKYLLICRKNIYYEVRLKIPDLTEETECGLGCTDREAETEYAASDLAREIKEQHLKDLGIVYCLRKKDCEMVSIRQMATVSFLLIAPGCHPLF